MLEFRPDAGIISICSVVEGLSWKVSRGQSFEPLNIKIRTDFPAIARLPMSQPYPTAIICKQATPRDKGNANNQRRFLQ